MTALRDLFDQDSPWRPAIETSGILTREHYLGATSRGLAYQDHAGVIVVASATSRRLPASWLEITRWCIRDRTKNAGSKQFRRFRLALQLERPEITTLISYSDPSVGHDGALYRACNFLWAPTWHRLRPPQSGNGKWKRGDLESVKDRWVYPLLPDPGRVDLLVAQDDSILRRFPWARYAEPRGADHKQFRKLMAEAAG